MSTTLARIGATIAVLIPATALAAPRSVTETAQYTLADSDSRNDARQICASTAKRTALDRAGSLFESGMTAHRSEKKGAVADDAHVEMRSYVAAVVASETIAEHFSIKNDRMTISCTVRLSYDPDEMGARLKKAAGGTEVNQHLAAQQAQIDILENQLKTLRSDVATPERVTAAAPAPVDPATMYPPAPDQSAPPPVAEAPPAAPPVAQEPPYQAPQYAAQQYAPPPSPSQYAPAQQYPAAAPPPTSWPTQAPAVYPVATAYAQPAPAYYYYPPAPAYAPSLAYYAPRAVYRGWYYGGGRRRW